MLKDEDVKGRDTGSGTGSGEGRETRAGREHKYWERKEKKRRGKTDAILKSAKKKHERFRKPLQGGP